MGCILCLQPPEVVEIVLIPSRPDFLRNCQGNGRQRAEMVDIPPSSGHGTSSASCLKTRDVVVENMEVLSIKCDPLMFPVVQRKFGPSGRLANF